MTTYRYSSLSRVARIEERHRRQHVSGSGDDEKHEMVSDGWWVIDDGDPAYSFQAGQEKPTFEVRARLRLIVEVEG